MGLACQDVPAADVTLTCDGDSDAFADLCRDAHADTGLAVTLVRRGKVTPDRLGQVRNNAVRDWLSRGVDPAHAGVVFLDGDCVPPPEFVKRHGEALARGDLVLAHRHDLSKQQTESFDDDALRAHAWPIEPTPEQIKQLDKRHKRYARQLFSKRLGLARVGLLKPNKPKILGGNFGTRLDRYVRVNGMDETFSGWGGEDDDYARRVYADGGTPVLAVRDIVALHQYHPTRSPTDWHDAPNAKTISTRRFRVRCERGLEDPMDQPPVRIDRFGS